MHKLKENLGLYLLIGLTLIAILIWSTIFHIESRNYLTVAFLDVGQGDSVLTIVTQYILLYSGFLYQT